MPLTIGTQLGSHEITGLLGKGGMGEVYRARDLRLKREVAIKILPEEFSRDGDRVSRFQREAEVLASLNHPNIGAIYDLQEAEGSRFLVLELVDGETLAERIARGPVPLEGALDVARQICDALEAAHEKGVVHRDLKPANVKISTDGKVKVLDFGLAKSLDSHAKDVNFSNSPTVVTAGATQENVLLGTAVYMSPEQVRGRAASEQSDIWAFGCVLYEMLTGRQAFTGETVTDIISGILRSEPDWNALPSSTPAGVRSIVKRCVEKERRQRYHAIGDVRIELQRPEAASNGIQPLKNRERMVWAVALLGTLSTIAALIGSFYFSPAPVQLLTSRLSVEIPAEASLPPNNTNLPMPAISPDGRYVAFMAGQGSPTTWRLWLRPIGGLAAQPMPGTEGIAPSGFHPFWSSDSRFIAFISGGKLVKIAIAGGPPQVMCDANGSSGTWNLDNVVLFDNQGSIHRVSAAGGVSTPIRTPDKSKNEAAFHFPSFLPDGRHFVYVATSTELGRTEVRVGSLDNRDDKSLFPANSLVMYSPAGYLLFVRTGTLMAQPFDAKRLTLTGDAFPVAEQIGVAGPGPYVGSAAFSVSNNGTLVYHTTSGSAPTELTWFDRSGNKLAVAPATGSFVNPNLSPDENRVAVEKIEGAATRDIWLIDLARGTSSRFTFDSSVHQYPVFSPDGGQILFVSDRSGIFDLYIKPANGVGDEKLLLKNANGVSDWSKDEKTVLYGTGSPFKIWALPMTGDAKPFPVVNQAFQYIRGKFSPDGRWVAYVSNETGRYEVYVQTFPPSGGKWQVSVDGGEYVYWRRDGKELIFGTADRKIFAVDIKLGSTFEAGVPRKLFEVPRSMAGVRFAITGDAQRFLIPLSSVTDRRNLMTVLNWTADLKK